MITEEKKKLGKIRHKLVNLVNEVVTIQSVSDRGNPWSYASGTLERVNAGDSNESGYYLLGKKIPLKSIASINGTLLIINDSYLKQKGAVA